MKKRYWLSLLFFSVYSAMVYGSGYQLYSEGSAAALGLGGAVTARTNLTSLAWYNPAALAGTDQSSVMAGGILVSLEIDYSGVEGRARINDDWAPVPHFYYVRPVGSNVTASLSINTPYGLATEWPDDWVGNYLSTFAEIRTIYVTPSLAWRFGERLAVSAGFNVVSSEVTLENSSWVLEGDAVAFGYTFAGHLQLSEGWALGAHYQSRVDVGFEGHSNQVSYLEVDLRIPSFINVGVANTSFDNLALSVDMIWTEWHVFDALQLEFFNAPQALPKDWSDTWSIRAGAEYALNEEWLLRAGYTWDNSPVPNWTRTPELPGADRHMYTVGFGWERDGLGLDFAYAYLIADDSSPAPFSGLTGEYGFKGQLVGLSGHWSF